MRIRLLRGDEALPPRPAAAQRSEKEQHTLARVMLERLWVAGNQRKVEVVIVMAFLDPAKAEQWAKELVPEQQEALQATAATCGSSGCRPLTRSELQERLRAITAMKLAETDLDEALALLPTRGDPESVEMLKVLAERFADNSPPKALRCADEGIARVRGLAELERAEKLAWFAGLVARLGQAETGRKLSEEAAEVAAQLPMTDNATRVRGEVAARVATFDLKCALALLEAVRDRNQRSWWLARVAAAASVNNFDEAQALWKELEPCHLSYARLWTACRLAETRVGDALQTIEGLEGDNAAIYKVEALGWIARSIAGRNKALACSLIDRASKLAMEPPTGDCSRLYEEMPVKAALLAVHAQRIGYPDLGSVVVRVLAARPPLGQLRQRAFQGLLAMAQVLALVDPEAAGQLLCMLEPRSAYIGVTDWHARTKTNWLTAWAFADPRRAIELAERELTAGSKDPGWDIGRSGVLDVALCLALPRSESLKLLGHRVGIITPCQ